MIDKIIKTMRRSPYQSLIAISVMSLMFLFVSMLLVLTVSSQIILQYFETRPKVIVYLKDDIATSQLAEIKFALEESGKVSQIKHLTKDDALAEYKKTFASDPQLLDLVTAKILPASIEFSTARLEDLKDVAGLVKDKPGVDKVEFLEDVVNNLIFWTSRIRMAGVILVSLLSAASMMIVLMVIGMKIAMRRQEIEIFQLVGASPWYIRIPYILEGAAYSVMGALISIVVVGAVAFSLSPQVATYFSEVPSLPLSPLYLAIMAGGELAAAFLLGALGAFLAVWRYLKV